MIFWLIRRRTVRSGPPHQVIEAGPAIRHEADRATAQAGALTPACFTSADHQCRVSAAGLRPPVVQAEPHEVEHRLVAGVDVATWIEPVLLGAAADADEQRVRAVEEPQRSA